MVVPANKNICWRTKQLPLVGPKKKTVQRTPTPSTHPDPWGANPRGRRTSSRSSSPWLRLRCGRWGRVRDVEPRATGEGVKIATAAFSHRQSQSQPTKTRGTLFIDGASDFDWWSSRVTLPNHVSVCLRACALLLSHITQNYSVVCAN